MLCVWLWNIFLSQRTTVRMIGEMRTEKTERSVQNCGSTTPQSVLPQQIIQTHCVMIFKSYDVHFGCDLSHLHGRDFVVESKCHFLHLAVFAEERISRCFCPQPLLAAPFARLPLQASQLGAWAFPFQLGLQWALLAQRGCGYGGVRSHFRSAKSLLTLLVESDTSQVLQMSLNRVALKRLRTDVCHVVSPDCTLRKTTSLLRTVACMHTQLKSKHLILPSPCLSRMPIAALASTCNSVASRLTPFSHAVPCIPMACCAAICLA